MVAVEFFLQHRKEGIHVLVENTRNEKKPSDESLAKNIGELASTSLTVREKASQRLEKNLYHAEPVLRNVLQNPKDLEQRRRMEALLAKIPTLHELKPSELRPLRVISILERIHSQESRDLLSWMAKKADSEHVKSEAKRSLRNLQP